MYYVHVIKSTKTNDLYFGFSSDLGSRLATHNQGKNISTKFGIPWELVYCEGFKSEQDARIRERKLKQYGNSRTHIKNRIQNSFL